MLDTVSAKSIRAQMPHGSLTCITGEPTYKQLKILEKELTANLIAIPCPWGHGKRHLGLLQNTVLYLQRNGAVITVPAVAPPEYPLNPPAAATTREAAQAANLANCKAWNIYISFAPSHATNSWQLSTMYIMPCLRIPPRVSMRFPSGISSPTSKPPTH